MVRLLNVATPLTALTVTEPFSAPGPLVRERVILSLLLATILLDASSTSTVTEGPIAVPTVVLVGCWTNTNCVAAERSVRCSRDSMIGLLLFIDMSAHLLDATHRRRNTTFNFAGDTARKRYQRMATRVKGIQAINTVYFERRIYRAWGGLRNYSFWN